MKPVQDVSHHPKDAEKLSYGKKFAQTEQLYAAHKMTHQLEELAREDGALEPDPSRCAPIGALPAAPELPQRAGFGDLLDDAVRYGGVIRMAVRDILNATRHLAHLPLDMGAVAAFKLRSLRA